MNAHSFFNDEQRSRLKNAVAQAELLTSGEIRVFIDDHCKTDVMEKALQVFNKLEMHNTKLKNGVLIYLSVKDRKFAIIGDQGIHDKVKDDFWNSTKEMMLEHFRQNQIVEGLIAGVENAGKALSTYFPRQHDDKDELSNEPVFGN